MNEHEYSYLIKFFADIVGFPVVISTFGNLTYEEKTKLNESALILENSLKEILPKLQDRPTKVHPIRMGGE